MKRIALIASLLAVSGPAFAAEYYIVQNPTSKVCTITEQRPSGSAGLVIGAPFGVRVEAENQMKTVKECTTTTGGPARTEEKTIIRER